MIVGRELIISFEDNGNGMTEETINKIFDPFYTTKDVGQGTGLGMSIVHGIVENHQGNMHIESTFNKGSKIGICLPLCPIKTVLRVLKD
jgi:signal transduction histidine kinase